MEFELVIPRNRGMVFQADVSLYEGVTPAHRQIRMEGSRLVSRLGSRLGAGRVRGYSHDEIGIEGHTDPFRQRDGRYHAACFQAGECGLGHAGAGGQFGLGQAQDQAAFTDGLADQEGAAGFGVSLAVLLAAAAVAGERLVVGVPAVISVHFPVEYLLGSAVLGFADHLGVQGTGNLGGFRAARLAEDGQ